MGNPLLLVIYPGGASMLVAIKRGVCCVLLGASVCARVLPAEGGVGFGEGSYSHCSAPNQRDGSEPRAEGLKGLGAKCKV